MKRTHGASGTRLYKIYYKMLHRCNDSDDPRYSYYGERGVTVCDEWRTGFIPFQTWALSNGYTKDLQIDRINNDGNYSPENCRWATRKQNCRNRRTSIVLTLWGQSKSITDWSEDDRCVVSYNILRDRLARRWELEKALTTHRMQSPGDGSCRWV